MRIDGHSPDLDELLVVLSQCAHHREQALLLDLAVDRCGTGCQLHTYAIGEELVGQVEDLLDQFTVLAFHEERHASWAELGIQ